MHRDRVSHIRLWGVRSPLLKWFAAAMQEPFLALTCLEISTHYKPLVLPALFLCGSAPPLRKLQLDSTPFPELPKLLLSAKGLVFLSLTGIPRSTYISPEALATGLSASTRLNYLQLIFRSPGPRFHPNEDRRPPLLPRVFLPALYIYIRRGKRVPGGPRGQNEHPPTSRGRHYILPSTCPEYFTSHQFIYYTEKFRELYQAEVVFCSLYVNVALSPRKADDRTKLQFRISSRTLDRQLSSLKRVRGSFLFPFFNLERLDIREDRHWRPQEQTVMESNQWLELLHWLTSVQDLYLSPKLAIRIAPTLQGLAADRVTGVLPALQNLFLKESSKSLQQSEPLLEAVRQFVAARRFSGQPVAVHRWTRGMWVLDTSADNG
jgi:hypothetical protein